MSSVGLYRCESEKEMPRKLAALIEMLGSDGIASLFRNKVVLLKPNLCADLAPGRGGTTHPAFVDAVIGFARDFGAEVIVGDGPIVGVKGRVFEKTGIADICRRHGIPLADFNREEGRTLRLENPLVLGEAMIAKRYFEADTVVNLPVFKSNIAYWLSGTLKNMKGFLVGREKHRSHYLGVPRSVADLNRMVRQDLILMDGFIGMMGNGPAAGRPADARLMLGGFDPVAVDAVAARLMGFPVKKIPLIQWAARAGVGSPEAGILGDPIDSFRLRFEKPTIARSRALGVIFDAGARAVFRTLMKRSRIVSIPERCTRCGSCEESCPFNAIAVHKEGVAVDREKCRLCLCCLEACTDEALRLKGILALSDAFIRSD